MQAINIPGGESYGGHFLHALQHPHLGQMGMKAMTSEPHPQGEGVAIFSPWI